MKNCIRVTRELGRARGSVDMGFRAKYAPTCLDRKISTDECNQGSTTTKTCMCANTRTNAKETEGRGNATEHRRTSVTAKEMKQVPTTMARGAYIACLPGQQGPGEVEHGICMENSVTMGINKIPVTIAVIAHTHTRKPGMSMSADNDDDDDDDDDIDQSQTMLMTTTTNQLYQQTNHCALQRKKKKLGPDTQNARSNVHA